MAAASPFRNGPENRGNSTSLEIILWDFESGGLLCAELREILQRAPETKEALVRVVSDVRLREEQSGEGHKGGALVVVILVLGSRHLSSILPQLQASRERGDNRSFLAVCEQMEPTDCMELLRLGHSDFLGVPLRSSEVIPRLKCIIDRRQHVPQPIEQLKEKLGSMQIVGESPALRTAVLRIPLIARCNATVLITGETGTGKEVFARAIHYLGPRSGLSFVPINCGAIPVELVENELFGHEPGAYTSAPNRQAGLLLEADGGTLFLDEIEALPLSAQVKLLRFLQDKEFRPLGSNKSRQVDVRIIAASNVNVEEAVRAGRFRQDLYYRLNVLSLALPPLRERREDIPLLAGHFIEKYAAEFARPARSVSPQAIFKLMSYSWPGNVREIENVIQRAVLQNESGTIEPGELVLPQIGSCTGDESFQAMKAQVVQEFERGYLTALLHQHQGNISAAARAAHKDRRAFWELLRKHRLLDPVSQPHSA